MTGRPENARPEPAQPEHAALGSGSPVQGPAPDPTPGPAPGPAPDPTSGSAGVAPGAVGAYSVAPAPAPPVVPPVAAGPSSGARVVASSAAPGVSLSDTPALLCKAGRIPWRIPPAVGAAALLTAAYLLAAQGESVDWWRRGLRGLRALVYGPINVGLGVVALWLVAFAQGRPLGSLHLAVGRMAGAVGLCTFGAALAPHLVDGAALTSGVRVVFAAGLYLSVLWSLFRADARTIGQVGCVHTALWLLFWAVRALESGADIVPF